MTKTLIDRIDETREKWVEELKDCRESLLNHHPIHVPNPLDRLVVELDYLLVEAKLALNTTLKAFDYACEDSLESVLAEMREQDGQTYA